MDEVLVGDVMTRLLLTVSPDQSVFTVWELLRRGEVHHVPVVTNDRCVAVVDDRLIATALAAGHTRVSDVLPPRVHCVLPETPLRRVAEIMRLEGATAVPVVDEHMHLLGLVTDRDVVAAVARLGVGRESVGAGAD